MSTEERLAALEEYVRRLALLTPPDWIANELSDLERVPEADERYTAARHTIQLLAAGQALKTERQVSTPPQTSQPAAPDATEVAKRSQMLLDRFEREVGISKSYAAVVTGAGYAALVALWSGFRDHIDRTSLLLSGCLVGLSVSLFVVWEMLKVMLTNRATGEYDKVVSEKFWQPDFEAAALAVRTRASSAAAAMNRYQPAVFWIGTVAGFGAAAILFWAGLSSAVGLKVSIGR